MTFSMRIKNRSGRFVVLTWRCLLRLFLYTRAISRLEVHLYIDRHSNIE
jgi:hypothetical protein